MRWVVGIFTCWLIVGFAFGALAQEGIEPQVLSVYYTEEPPVIDGDLAEWEHLTPIYLSSAAPPWLQGFRVWEPLVTREPVIAPTLSSAQIWLFQYQAERDGQNKQRYKTCLPEVVDFVSLAA